MSPRERLGSKRVFNPRTVNLMGLKNVVNLVASDQSVGRLGVQTAKHVFPTGIDHEESSIVLPVSRGSDMLPARGENAVSLSMDSGGASAISMPAGQCGGRATVTNAFVPRAPVSESIENWRRELESDFNRTFVLNGLEFGFMIVDRPCNMKDIVSKNYRSVLLDDRVKVEKQL